MICVTPSHPVTVISDPDPHPGPRDSGPGRRPWPGADAL